MQRQILDPALDDEVFEVEAAKREAEVANMNMGRSKIGPQDPRRQHLEGFLGDPSNRKGNRSYPAVAPAAAGPRPTGGQPQPSTTTPDVLVVGPDASSRLPQQAKGEFDIQARFAELTGHDATLIPLLDPIRLAALQAVNDVGRHGIRKITFGAGEGGDAANLTEKVTAIVSTFERDTARAVEQGRWESTVAARNAFIASKPNPPMAARALERSKQDISQAGTIYDTLYQVVGFDEKRVTRLAATSNEAAMLDLHSVIPATAWAEFLMAATGSNALLAFALAHKADLAGLANAGAVVRVWQANPAHVTSVVDANTVLSLGLVNQDAANGVAAAKLLGTPQVPDVATLSNIDHAAQIPDMQTLSAYTGVGGDVVATKDMRALDDPPTLEDIKAFNLKVGRTPQEARSSWALLQANVVDSQKKSQIVRTVAKVDKANLTNFTTLVTNWAALSDRQRIDAKMVTSFINAGLLVPQGKAYSSGKWGPGCVYVFKLAGQGRLFPEWHLHFQFGAKTTVAGGGWKDQDEAYGQGVKTYVTAPKLEDAIRDAGKWLKVRPSK